MAVPPVHQFMLVTDALIVRVAEIKSDNGDPLCWIIYCH
jgi:hypothetical protein